MRRKAMVKPETSMEFELDLAPLLAVMVKLVPVLLISSAFVQMMVIDTELPQAVQEAMAQSDKTPETTVGLKANLTDGFTIVVSSPQGQKEVKVPPKEGQLDFAGLHGHLVEVKKQYPKIFRIGLSPGDDLAYGDIVRMMDEARRARDPSVSFPLEDSTTGEKTSPYMFPDIIFTNTLGEAS